MWLSLIHTQEVYNCSVYAWISTVYADNYQIFPESGCTICMVHASGKCGDGSPPRATGSRSQAKHRADQDTGGRGRVSGTGGIGSCQGSGRSRSGNENNLGIPIPLPVPPNFSRLNIPTVGLRGDISMALLFSCDTSFFHMDLSFCADFHPFAALFSLQSHFSCGATEAISRQEHLLLAECEYRALVVFGSSREERVKG